MKADVWDSGNRMTRFEEITEVCELCDGRGVIEKEDDDGYVIRKDCEECGGEGIITYYK